MFTTGTASTDRCFLCCEPLTQESRTKEHFVPRCFYEGGRLPDEPDLCLPAHGVCNGSTSRDEEWMALNLSLSNPLGGRNEERWARTIRALKRPEAAGLKERLMSGMVELPGGAAALKVGTDRVIWVLAKMVKGLCLRACGTLLDAETQWTVRHDDYEEAIAVVPHWSIEIPAKGDISQRGAVVLAKGVGFPEHRIFNWHIFVHGQHPFFVTTVPRDRLRPEAVRGLHDCMRLTWPKPTTPRTESAS